MTTFHLPDLGEGLAEAEIVRWHVKVGDRVTVDQPMLAVETAKAVVEVPSPHSGVVTALHGSAGDIVPTGAPLIDFEVEGEASAAPAGRAASDAGTVVGNMLTTDEELVETAIAGSSLGGAPKDRVRAAPAARALARKLNVSLEDVHGTGRGGIVTVDDVLAVTQPAPHIASAAGHGTTASFKGDSVRGLRRAMAQSMSLARDQVMGCTLFDDADLHLWPQGEDFTARLLRAIAAAVRAEPALNAWFDGERQTRRLMDRLDVAMAVDTPEGLLVPVIRGVDGRAADELRRDVDRLKRAARDRSVSPEELRDFTFMLSNFGTLAGRYATPVVVPPAVAILGAGRLSQDVVAVAGGFAAHPRMPLSLTFDHRCVTGAEAARFLAALIGDLERGN